MNQILSTDLLRMAYMQGFFPMPEPGTGDILWYSPDPRAIIPLDGFYVSRSLKRSIRNRGFRLTVNTAFGDVMANCAARSDTWINADFLLAYQRLFDVGDAHSVEVWLEDSLVGGLYGVSLGGAFFAESKFHKVRDASKVALEFLVRTMMARGMTLLEVQFLTPHLQRLGAVEIPAEEYHRRLLMALASDATFR